MAKILYGVAGEGTGHAMRAKEITNYLLSLGHQVKIVSYDRGYKNLSSLFDVMEIEGLGFSFENNQVRYIETFIKNGKKLKEILGSYVDVDRLVKEFRPNIIITDFEPTCAVAARTNRIPLISIDNQHFISGTAIEYPKKYAKEALMTNAFVQLFVPNAKKYLALTFVKERIINKKVLLFSPILRKEVIALKPTTGNYILVYLTAGFEGAVEYLEGINCQFVVYGLGRVGREKNIVYKKPSQEEFLDDLCRCRGIIANAGFGLISEALYLGKPYFAIPLKNHFEQIINAYYLEKMGYGVFCEKMTMRVINDFLDKISEYQINLEQYPKEDNAKILAEINRLIKEYGTINC
ncbi:MAG: MJ1255/VC2487 family glycosyltransferase [Candidatus Moraniibacteriota bacterium]